MLEVNNEDQEEEVKINSRDIYQFIDEINLEK